jgi:threonine dehydrogenase-like Zn-dependent dehydrogenase
MPRELIAPAPNQVAFRDIPRQPLGPTQLRVRTLYAAAKHGTEMALYKGYANPRGAFDPEYRIFRPEIAGVNYPVTLGNICVGEITEIGSQVEGFSLGERVFRYSPFRDENVWEAAAVRRLPDGVPWQAAACLDPTHFALGAVRDGHVRIGDAVAVFGMGAIGLLTVQFARLAGAYPVIAVDPIALRRDLATQCGADLVLDPGACDAGLEIKRATGKRGADVCIEYSGSHHALQAALRGVAYDSVVVAGAWPGAYPAGLDFGAEAHMNRPRIVFSRTVSEPNPDYPNWDGERVFEVGWRYLSSGAVQSVPIVHPIVPFESLIEEYPKIATDPAEYIKLGVVFDQAR